MGKIRKGVIQVTAAERLMDQFRAGSHTAVAVHDPSNMFYLTEGYTGEGVVYLSEHSRVIITDFRYTEQAERQAPGFRVEMISKGRGHSKVIAELAHAEGITELRAETNYLSVDDFEALRGAVGEEISCVPLAQAPQKLRHLGRLFLCCAHAFSPFLMATPVSLSKKCLRAKATLTLSPTS